MLLIKTENYYKNANIQNQIQTVETGTNNLLKKIEGACYAFYKNELTSNFFANQVIGDLFFSTVFFGAYFLITRQNPSKLIPIKVKS